MKRQAAPTRPSASSALEWYRLDYPAACERVRRHVAQLAHARRLLIAVELGPAWAEMVEPAFHMATLTLSSPRRETVICFDHPSFIGDDEAFRKVALPQIRGALDKLTRG